MSDIVISVEDLSKMYQLGVIGTGSFRGDVQRWWAKLCGKPDPFLRIGEVDHGNRDGETLWALQNINFQVERGEAIGIIGRNGAGKSTLLKILSRVTAPTSGLVRVKGRIASLLEVGTGFHPELTGRENIFLNGAILGMSRQEIGKKFDEIVDFSGVEKFIDTPVKRYSSGMYVRLAFAVAAHLEPEILIVDEVLAVGDAEFQKKCLGKMGDVASEGRTVLFVSHNMLAIKSLCKQAIHLRRGQIYGIGDVDQIVQDYLQEDSASLREQVWQDEETAPGNEIVRLHRVCVSSLESGLEEFFYVDKPLKFEFEIWNRVDGANLNFSLFLSTVDGLLVFATASAPQKSHKGLVRGVVHFPENFLNDNYYRVGIMVVKDSVSVFHNPEVLVFQVHDTPRGEGWLGKWPGVLRPDFDWSVEDI